MSDTFQITGGGSATPGGSSGDIQYNNAGILGGVTKVPLANGGTNVDLSASGSTTAVLAQDASHIVSARALVAADIPTLDAAKIGTGAIALARGGTAVDLSASGSATAFLTQDASHVVSARSIVATDLPLVSTADQSYFIGGGFGTAFGSGTGAFYSGLANTTQYVLFHLPFGIKVRKGTISVSATSGSSKIGVALYSADGQTKLIDVGPFNGASGTVQTNTVTGVDFPPGFYIYAWASSVTSTLTALVCNTTGGAIGVLNNQTVKKFGKGSNTMDGAGAMPSALGTLTSALGVASLVCVFEP